MSRQGWLHNFALHYASGIKLRRPRYWFPVRGFFMGHWKGCQVTEVIVTHLLAEPKPEPTVFLLDHQAAFIVWVKLSLNGPLRAALIRFLAKPKNRTQRFLKECSCGHVARVSLSTNGSLRELLRNFCAADAALRSQTLRV